MKPKTLSERAKLARHRSGFESEADAAKAIGCSRTLVISWEDGTAKSVGGKYLMPAARVYRVRPQWLRLESDVDGYPWSESDSSPPDLQIARLQNDIHALNLALSSLLAVMADHRPVEARDLVDALRSVPEEYRNLGLAYELAEGLDADLARPRSKKQTKARR